MVHLKRSLGLALDPAMQAAATSAHGGASHAAITPSQGESQQDPGQQNLYPSTAVGGMAAAGGGVFMPTAAHTLPQPLPEVPDDAQEAAAFMRRCGDDTVNVSQTAYLIALHVSFIKVKAAN